METPAVEQHGIPVGPKKPVSFTTKKIVCQQSLGECLAAQRVAQSLTLEQAARQLNINIEYLQALEQGHEDQLPGTVYALAFLRSYARLLNLNVTEVVRRYRSEMKIQRHARGKVVEDWRPVRRAAWWNFLTPGRMVRHATLVLVTLTLLAYLGFKVQAIVQPPFLAVSSPADELLTDNSLLNVAGQAHVGSTVTINGQEVLLDGQGKFSTPVDLQPGVNLIRVTARKNHSNVTVIIRRVVLEPKD